MRTLNLIISATTLGRLIQAVPVTILPSFTGVSLTRVLETYNASAINPTLEEVKNMEFRRLKQFPTLKIRGGQDHVQCISPVECWRDYEIVGPPEAWIKNPDNVQNSGALWDWKDFYSEYISQSDSVIGRCHAKGMGALQCYASTYWSNHNFDCRLDQLQKCQIPTETTILAEIDKKFSMLTDEEKTWKARAVFFTIKNFETIALNHRTLHDLQDIMKSELMGLKDVLVETFTPQKDLVAAAKCRFAQDMMRLTFQLMLHSFTLGMGLAFDAQVDRAEQFGELAVAAVKNSMVVAGESGYYATQAELAAEILASRVNSGQPAAGPSKGLSEVLRLTIGTAGGMCGNSYGVGTDDNKARIAEFTQYVIKTLDQIQTTLERNFQEMLQYHSENPENTVLNLFMSEDQWTLSDEQAHRSFSEIKREARQSITNMVISELLTASRCYQDCEPWGDNFERVCNGKEPNNRGKPDELNQLSRSCFPEDKMRCQMQCLTKQVANNRKTFLPGLSKLKEFGITPEALSKNSWRAYRTLGFKSFDAQEMLVDGQLQPASTSLRLPVCVAREGQERISLLKKKEAWSKGMPMNCGYRAEDTQRFHERIGLDVNQEAEFRRWHVFANLKAEETPLERYLNLCELNLMFPKSGHRFKKNQKDEFCDTVKANTWEMDLDDGNAYFCNMVDNGHLFKEGREAFRVRYDEYAGTSSLKNFARKCKEWNHHHKEHLSEEAKRRVENMVKEGQEELSGKFQNGNFTVPHPFGFAPWRYYNENNHRSGN